MTAQLQEVISRVRTEAGTNFGTAKRELEDKVYEYKQQMDEALKAFRLGSTDDFTRFKEDTKQRLEESEKKL